MENVVIDPLGGLPPEISEDMARNHAAALVKGGGVTLEQANAALSARNAAPLTANSRDMAEAARDALLNDSAFVRRYSEGDPDAIAKLFQADLRAQQTSGKLTDRPPQAADYNLRVGQYLPADVPADKVQSYESELSKLAASIRLPEASAKALAEDHIAAVKETAGMTAEELEAWGNTQTATLYKAIGPDAEARIKAASETLTRMRSKETDLAKIVRSNGASLALNLLFQAETLI